MCDAARARTWFLDDAGSYDWSFLVSRVALPTRTEVAQALERLPPRFPFGSGSAHTSNGVGVQTEPHDEQTDPDYFLIAFDPKAQELVECREFALDDAAEAALIDAEENYRGTDIQVVSFQAASIDDLKRTHPHYFEQGHADAAPFPLVGA